MTFSATQPDCMICCLLSMRSLLNVCGAFSFIMDNSGGDKLKVDTNLYYNHCSIMRSFNRRTMHLAIRAIMPCYAPS